MTAAAAALSTAPFRPDVTALAVTRSQLLADLGEAELQLEEELQEMLRTSGAPASVSPLQAAAIDGVIRRLEQMRGRAQRAGWGQSDSRWDMPFIGAWDVIYTTEQANYAPAGAHDRLVTAREWIYGPGEGGGATECVYATSSGLKSGSLLIARTSAVTKLPDEMLRLDVAPAARAYALTYSTREARRLQQADGSWATVEREVQRETPAAGALLASDAQMRQCSPRGGVRRTTYLSDTVWIERTSTDAAPAAAATGSGGGVSGGGGGSVTVLRRTEAEALAPPQNGGVSADGFDAKRFGPSGRREWMLDSGYNAAEAATQYGRMRMRADDDISRS